MKEYTIIYNAEITEIVKPGETWSGAEIEEMETQLTHKELAANWLRRELNADDVHVKSIKVFEREL